MFNRHTRKVLVYAAGTVSAVLMSGCVDDNYDLEDIDRTVEIGIKDLTLPLNLSPIKFDDMVDLTDNECVDTINGEYVLIKGGTFDSDDINIAAITASPTAGSQPPVVQCPIYSGVSADIPGAAYHFSYTHEGVDKYILSIDRAALDFDIQIRIATTTAAGGGVNVTYSDMVFSLPRGLYGYCVETGQKVNKGDAPELRFNQSMATDGIMTFTYHVTSIEADDAGIDYNSTDRRFHYEGSIAFKSGKIKANSPALDGTTGNVAITFNLGVLNVISFEGDVYYDLEDLDAEDVILNDLPDVLTDNQTNIALKNPQVYLTLNNPLSAYGVTGASGLTIYQNRTPNQRASMPRPLELKPVSGTQHFCLSPQEPEMMYEPFASAKWYQINNLGNVLSGQGIPSKLFIDFDHPQMKPTHVTNFLLGQNLGKVHGEYTFYAPLEFAAGSQVIYSEAQSGWDFGDDDMRIKLLSVQAHVKSNLPVDVTLEAIPLDSDGNQLTDLQTGKPLTVTPVSIPANGDKDIVIEIKGEFNSIDGMRYTVRLAAGQDASVLRPTMNLSLTNLKAVVNGSYVSEL